MGTVAANGADHIYLTDDETYTEDPEAIRTAVLKGITEAGGEAKTAVVPDRLEAIRQAFRDAKPGDTVLLAGIGHQDYRAMGGQKMPWDEREVARQVLAER
jgi:UDP-N-acetylmuramoyl-L-alanyl-D-glutamate--2,6-diaminopimelate ligase